jgi:hypothetical protein
MSDDYDVRLKQVQERNDLILGHFVHVWRGRVSDETLYQHVLNIQGFTDHYLNYSAEADELRSGDQITSWDVYGYLSPEAAAEIIERLKEDRQEMIESAVTYYDEPEEEESPEAFQARMQDLVERWKTIHQESKKET